MKIAIITSGFLPIPATKGGAVENLLMNLIKENEKKSKVEFNIFSIYDEMAQKESLNYKNSHFYFIKTNFVIKILDNITFFIVKNIFKKKNSQSFRYIFQRLYYFNKCSLLLKDGSFDKVILENHPSQYLTLKWRKNYVKYKNNYYYHCHNQFPGTYGCINIIKNTKEIICVSSFRKNSVMEYMKMDASSFSVLYNAVDRKTIEKKASIRELYDLRIKYNIGENEKILLFTGRIVPGKGIDVLIEALKKLKNNNYKLLVLGSSLNSLNVRNRFEQDIFNNITNKIRNKIVFTGFIDYNDLYKFYCLADIAVLPSIMEDSAPLTVIESLCCGLPIITTDSGGIPEYAKNDSAIIIKRDNNIVENLAKSIDELLFNDYRRKQMSNNSYEASKKFTVEKYYDEFLTQIDIKDKKE